MNRISLTQAIVGSASAQTKPDVWLSCPSSHTSHSKRDRGPDFLGYRSNAEFKMQGDMPTHQSVAQPDFRGQVDLWITQTQASASTYNFH